MENNGSPLKNILEKADYFSNEIDKLHRQVQDVRKEKKMLAKQEENLNNDILSTAKVMHKFLYETISKMTGLSSMIQYELENEESKKTNITQQKNSLNLKKNLRLKQKNEEKNLKKSSDKKGKEVFLFDLYKKGKGVFLSDK